MVYTAAEADQLPAYAESFRRVHPEIRLLWVRDSTGVVAAKLLAERRAPRADVVFALAATSQIVLDRAGLLAPYAPAGLDRVPSRFRDGRSVPHWTGEALWGVGFCVNTLEARRRGWPIPQSWEDLARPIYRGGVIMPSPASSGTGLLAVSSILQRLGPEQGWAYLERLDRNIISYDHSGSKPCKDAARGEVPIGVSLDFRGAAEEAEGLPVKLVLPREGVGWDLEATSLVRGARHPAAARAFVDWAFSPAAMRLYARNLPLAADAGAAPPPPPLPPDYARRLALMSLTWTAERRDALISEWSRRFGSRTDQDEAS